MTTVLDCVALEPVSFLVLWVQMKGSPIKIHIEEWFYPMKWNTAGEIRLSTGYFKFIFQILPVFFSCIYHSVDLMLEFASRKLGCSNDSDLGIQVSLKSFNNN